MIIRLLLLLLSGLLLQSTSLAASLTVTLQDSDGEAITDAVVMLHAKNKRRTPKPMAITHMPQRNRQFVHYVLPVTLNTQVDFPNYDAEQHHVYSFSATKAFEIQLYRGTPSRLVHFDKAGPVALGCNIHDWMIGYIYVVDTPYFGQTKKNGKTSIKKIPKGQYQLSIWHPRQINKLTKSINIHQNKQKIRLDGISMKHAHDREPPELGEEEYL